MPNIMQIVWLPPGTMSQIVQIIQIIQILQIIQFIQIIQIIQIIKIIQIIQFIQIIQIRDPSALKDVDHQAGIDDLSDDPSKGCNVCNGLSVLPTVCCVCVSFFVCLFSPAGFLCGGRR